MATAETPLTLRRLEDHLWQAADLFRNKVSNQKDYILALLFASEAAEVERDSERYGRERVAEVVDQVREQSDRVRYEEDRELRDRGDTENRKAERNCFDAFARTNDRAVDGPCEWP